MEDAISSFVSAVNNVVWGVPMLAALGITGIFLTVGLRFVPIRYIPYGFRLLTQKGEGEGDISPFQALMTALAATVGTGNIAGVATAIFFGGPGALFYMWLIALIGMATKYSEAVLAVTYREVDHRGDHVGGPMYYIKNGIGPKVPWLAAILAPAFALFAALAGFGIGNMVQANSVSHALEDSFGIPTLWTGLAMALFVGAVLIGGIRRIADVASALVPFMVIAYIGACLVILAINVTEIPSAIGLIFTHAFTPTAAVGGFAGASVAAAIRWGVARGVFSNEAGLGSAPIAHAAAKTDDPVRQGMVAMLGTFIDTIIVCTMTGLVIITSGLWTSGVNGAALTANAFDAALPGVGGAIVAIGLAVFAFSTALGWSYYGERSVQFLLGEWAIWPFRLLWIVALPIGATYELRLVWGIADALNAMMAIPNLIALLILAPTVFAVTSAYLAKLKAS